MEPTGTFELASRSRLRIDHSLNERDELFIEFRGNILMSHGERFSRYLTHLEELGRLASETPATRVHCHLEGLGEALSRAQHAIYRMLNAMRGRGIPVIIYVARELPEQSEHLEMSRLFVEGLSRRPGPPLELIEVTR